MVTRVITKVSITITTYNTYKGIITVLTKSYEPPSKDDAFGSLGIRSRC